MKQNDLSLVSVIVPTYNRESFIRFAIESIFRQTYPAERVEVIVVDDGSNDNTSNILKGYGGKILCVRQPNKGIASARNEGIERAKGEIISFLDADDIWHEERLEKIAGAFYRNQEIGMVYHPFSLIDSGGEVVHDNFYGAFGYEEGLSGQVANEIFSGRIFCGGSSFAFRKSVIDRIYPVPEDIRRGVDYYVTALSSCLAEAEYIPDILGKYRFHGNNTTMFAGLDDVRELANVNRDFAHMRGKLIERIMTFHDLNAKGINLDIIRRRQAQEKTFYHILNGDRIEGIKLIPVLFKGGPGLQASLRALMVCLMALFMPASLYSNFLKLHEILKRWKIIRF